MFKLLLKLLKDERGLFGIDDAVLAGSAIAGGSSLLGGLFGKKKEKTYDPYAQLRSQYTNYLGGKLGTSTPYEYNDAFTIDQPAIEKQTESAISQGLGNLPQKRTDIFDINQKYGAARKAQLGLQQEEDVKKQKDMYNRLGLVSSTPGLQAETDLRYKQGLDKAAIDAEIAQQGIGQEMDAEKLYQDIANQYISQGQTLGQTQRGSQQYSQQMSESDIARMVAEEQAYSQQANSILGGNPPQVTYDPNIWAQLGQTGTDIGSLLAMYGILGKK